MKFIKLETSDGEIRWINLDMVSRVTLVKEPEGTHELMVIIFADAATDARVQIRSDSEANQHAIARLREKLDSISDHVETLEVA
jgi:hypothetical protein